MAYAEFVRAYRFPFHHCIDTLIVGVIAAILYRDAKASGRSHARLANGLAWGGLPAVAWLLGAGELLGRIDWWQKTLQPTVIGLAFGAVVLGCALGGGPQRLLSGAPLRMVARVSYPLYLIHMALIPLCWHLVGATPADGGRALLAFLPVFSAASFLAALAIHFVTEKPFLLLKDRIKAERRPGRYGAATALGSNT